MTTEGKANLLFRGNVANGETKYVEVPIVDGKLGCHIGWKTTASSATITLELTSVPVDGIDDAGAGWVWLGSGITITGPSGAAIGSVQVNVENCRQTDARLKIVGAAASVFEIWNGLPA